MKYSNLETMNAWSIRWSTVASKLERGRLHCNLLDTLACSNLATSSLLNALLEAKVPGWLQPPPLTEAYPVTVSPWFCFYPSTVYTFLACSCSLSALPGLSFTPLNQFSCSYQSCSSLALITSLVKGVK
jgi:hypothetical protein